MTYVVDFLVVYLLLVALVAFLETFGADLARDLSPGQMAFVAALIPIAVPFLILVIWGVIAIVCLALPGTFLALGVIHVRRLFREP